MSRSPIPPSRRPAGAGSGCGPMVSRLRSLLEKVAAGALHVEIARTFPLAEAARAFEANMEGSESGKLLIDATR